MRLLGFMVMMIAFSGISYGIAEGDFFPKVEIAKNEKGKFHSDMLKGKVTVVNFWATWCEACKVELKEMQQDFASLLKEKDFQFMFVSLDKDPSKASTWVRENMKDAESFLEYLYQDPEFSTADSLNVDSFPMTFVIGKDGKIIKIQRGFKEGEGSTRQIAEAVQGILKG